MLESEFQGNGKIRFLPVGDRALTVEFGNSIDEKTNERVRTMAEWIEEKQIRGVRETVPTFRSLLICYDPGEISYDELKNRLAVFEKGKTASFGDSRRILEVPCLYDGEDLEDLCAMTGLSKEEMIAIHSGKDYRIYMLGFLPGFVYLGGLDERIHAPRLRTPRTKIPAGSVGIGGSQTGIYPLDSPGGWRLIGKTPIKMYAPFSKEPVLCRAGEFIRFRPVDAEEFSSIGIAVTAGRYQPVWKQESAGGQKK